MNCHIFELDGTFLASRKAMLFFSKALNLN